MAITSLLRKLSHFADLTAVEAKLLADAASDVRMTPAKRDIIREGARPEHLHLIVEGWAIRYKILRDGSRQITAFLLPGDFCDLHTTILNQMDHGVGALTSCKVAWICSDRFDRLTAEHGGLTRALWWATLLDEAILRDWVANIGRRAAYARVAHLLCELCARLNMVGLVTDGHLDLPVTQQELADATGLTPVHVNRTLQRLRKDELIELSGRALTVRSAPGLQNAAGFDPSYLHIKRRDG